MREETIFFSTILRKVKKNNFKKNYIDIYYMKGKETL